MAMNAIGTCHMFACGDFGGLHSQPAEFHSTTFDGSSHSGKIGGFPGFRCEDGHKVRNG
jgi:hypothetical protein